MLPYSGGLGIPITSYDIQIMKSDGSFIRYPSNCNGNDTTVITNRYCLIDMSVITGSTFGLVQGTLVKASISATNARG